MIPGRRSRTPFTAASFNLTRMIAVLALLAAPLCVSAQNNGTRPSTVPADPAYAEVAAYLDRVIAAEMRDKQLPAVSIALVDRDRIVWARGFGEADSIHHVAATAETVYRVGSVSKLFTDIGIMQLVENGSVSLDAPVSKYLPDFHPSNRFGVPITLRELTSHRAGLMREPPQGNYFDSLSP